MIGAVFAAAQPAQRRTSGRARPPRPRARHHAVDALHPLLGDRRNDVDFHIQDAQHGHAYYASRQLPRAASCTPT